MRQANHQRRGTATLAAALIALALFVRLLVPAGWMPSDSRAFTLMLCGAAPAAAMPHAEAHHAGADAGSDHGHADGGDQPGHQPCAFTAAAAALDQPMPPADAIVPVTPRRATIAFDSTAPPIVASTAPPPPATGPPTA